VDDAQWLDHESAQVLTFAARRLGSESVGIIFGARALFAELTGLPETVIDGLREEQARELLGSVLSGPVDPRVRDQIVADTRGNPLAILELPRGMTAAQLAGGFGLPATLGLSATIEETFRSRAEALPPEARRLLLLAAAEPLGDPLLLWRAAAQLGTTSAAAAVIEEAGLVVFGARVRFRHPLVRSAVYRAASGEDRRAVHGALAEATDPEVDPDRRVWHRAQAVLGPNEDVAWELERSAGRAQARGGMAAGAAFLERSSLLTVDPVRRAERALAAAEASLQAGAFDKTLELLSAAAAGPLHDLASARVDLLRGQTALASTGGSDAPALLLKAAARMEQLDARIARETYLDAWTAAMFAGGFALAGGLREVCSAAKSAPSAPYPPRPSDQLLEAFAVVVTEGRTNAAPLLKSVMHTFVEGEISIEEGLRWGWVAVNAAIELWDAEGWYAILVRQLESVRQAGRLAHLPIYLTRLAVNATWRGELAAADALASEAGVNLSTTGTALAPYAALLLAAYRGLDDEASQLMEGVMSRARAVGQGLAIQSCQFAQGVLYNGLGRYEEARTNALAASEQAPELHVAAWALPELIEAAARTDETGVAIEALDRLTEATSAGGTDWGLGVAERSRALVSQGEEAEGLYLGAIERLGRTRLRPELARTHLLYGEWLRRERRRVDAREHLRKAHEMFSAIGMEAFAARASHELAATGETVRKRSVNSVHDLTPQEMQIAQLVAEHRTNQEIGTQLFISARTVEWHLRKVFAKLNVGSRRELRENMTRRGLLSPTR
jgi:DNA-binding CsgD family transcriptional regulator/tetratricopeptide (TPR) repeat protein